MTSEFDLQARQSWATTTFGRRWREHDAEAPAIIEYVQQLRAEQRKPIDSNVAVGAKSMGGLFESPLDLFDITDHPGMLRLIEFIDKSVRSAVAHVNGRRVHPNKLKVTFNESWYHVTNSSGFHAEHYHPGCSWCGIYYLQAGDATPSDKTGAGNGVNRFFSPIGFGGMHVDYGGNYLQTGRFDITPVDGLLFLFPSYLLHSGLPYHGDKDRIIFSFNSVTHVDENAEPPASSSGML